MLGLVTCVGARDADLDLPLLLELDPGAAARAASAFRNLTG